jgi:hypothetical protein
MILPSCHAQLPESLSPLAGRGATNRRVALSFRRCIVASSRLDRRFASAYPCRLRRSRPAGVLLPLAPQAGRGIPAAARCTSKGGQSRTACGRRPAAGWVRGRAIGSSRPRCDNPGRMTRQFGSAIQQSASTMRQSGLANRPSGFANRQSGSPMRQSGFANQQSGSAIRHSGTNEPTVWFRDPTVRVQRSDSPVSRSNSPGPRSNSPVQRSNSLGPTIQQSASRFQHSASAIQHSASAIRKLPSLVATLPVAGLLRNQRPATDNPLKCLPI